MSKPNTRAILASNLRRLMDHDRSVSVRAWAMGKGLDVRMIDRLVKGQHAVTLDKLEEIAAACGVQPWHLLLEDFEPGDATAPPVSAEDRELLKKLKRVLRD